nr:hypothetical protein [uncultured Mediterranean phage uvMED]
MFGFNRNRSTSSSEAKSFIDPSQQPYLEDIYRRAQTLGTQEMPIQGTAGINPQLSTALANQYNAGGAIAGAGTGMMTAGSNLAGGSNQALTYANRAMGGGAGAGVRTALNAGNRFANNGRMATAAQGSGVNMPLANQMAGSTTTVGPAQISGPNMSIATHAANLATGADVTANQGLNPNDLGRYINNDILDGQINAASRDVMRNLTEQVKPTIAANAAITGNSGSSRRAVQDAIAERGAADRVADISSGIRSNAYNQALGFEANRAAQNAQLEQTGRQFDAGARNQLAGQGLGIAGNQSLSQAQLVQQAQMGNQTAINALRSQGYNIGANQLQANLARQQDADQFSAGQYNTLLGQGAELGQNAYNTNQQNQQFGASLANQVGQQGFNTLQSGADMLTSGVSQQRDMGEYQRAYDQALLEEQYRREMAPYAGLEYYRNLIGDPTKLNTATSKGKTSGFGFQFSPPQSGGGK